MMLDPSSFNRLIGHMGQTVRWRQSFACPCINPHSGAAKPGCPICIGKGRGWSTSVDCDAGITSQKAQREWAQSGLYESGDVVITLPSDSVIYAMGQFDRAVLANSSERFSFVLTRGTNDVLRFPLLTVTRVFWLDAGGITIIDGGIPTVSASGVMTWATGEPAPGTAYTIEGTRMLEYFCFSMMPSNRGIHHGELLPRKVVLRKFDLFGK